MSRIRMTRGLRWFSALLLLVSLLLAGPARPTGAAVSAAAFDAPGMAAAAARMVQLGLYQGVQRPDGTYDLALTSGFTRAEYVALIVRAMGQGNAAAVLRGATPFTDVAGHWASGLIAAAEAMARQHGNTLSGASQLFRPDAPVTVAEVPALLMKILGIREVPSLPWPADYLRGGENADLYDPADLNLMLPNPNGEATRGFALYVLDRAFSRYVLPGGKTVYTTYVDLVAPTLTVYPVPTSTIGPEFLLGGTVSGAANLTVAGSPVTFDATGHWQNTVSLRPGANAIEIKASDIAGNVTARTIAVTSIPPYGGQLNLDLWNSPDGNFNPITVSDTYGERVAGLLYDGLWRYDQHGAPTPGLAQSWDWNSAGDTLTLHLRPGATFFDGTPVTAADVVFTYKAIFHPKYEGPGNWGFENVMGWDEYHKGTAGETPADFAAGLVTTAGLPGLYAPDQETVVFKLNHPDVTFLQTRLIYAPVDHKRYAGLPVQLWGTADDSNNLAPNGTGPFRLSHIEPGSYVLLSANQDYWAGRPFLDSILLDITSLDDALSEIQLGHLHQLEFTATDYDTYKGVADSGLIKITEYPDMLYQMMQMNTRAGYTAEKAVRQAISYAIDRNAIIHNLMKDRASPMYGPVHPMSWAYTDPVNCYDYDPDKARALLDGAGWVPGPDGVRVKNGARLHLRLAYPTTNPTRQATVPVLQQWLRQIGIEVEPVLLDWTAYNQKIFGEHDFDLMLIGVQLGNTDPDPTGVWDKAATTSDGFNATGWWTEQSEQLIVRGRSTGDPQQRRAIYAQWADLFNEDAPAYFFYAVNTLTAVSPWVQNYHPGPQGQFWNIDQVWLAGYPHESGVTGMAVTADDTTALSDPTAPPPPPPVPPPLPGPSGPPGIVGTIVRAGNSGQPAWVGVRGTGRAVKAAPDGSFYLPVPAGGAYDIQVFAPGCLRANTTALVMSVGATGIGQVVLTPGDLDDSGAIDAGDLAEAAAHWRTPDPVADYVAHREVDLADLAVIARNAGLTAPTEALPVSPLSVEVLGRALPSGVTPLLSGGRLHLPLDALGGLGFTVTTTPDGQETAIAFQGHTFLLKASGAAVRDGIVQEGWETPAMTTADGRVYVPFDLLASAIGLQELGGRVTGVWSYRTNTYKPPAGIQNGPVGDDPVYIALAAGWLGLQSAAGNAGSAGLTVPDWLTLAGQSGQLPAATETELIGW